MIEKAISNNSGLQILIEEDIGTGHESRGPSMQVVLEKEN